MQDDRLEEGHHERDRDGEEADPEEEPGPRQIHPPRGGDDLTPRPAPRDPQRAARTPRRPRREQDDEHGEQGERTEDDLRAMDAAPEEVRSARDRPAERVGRGRAEHASPGDGVASNPPTLGPRDRPDPLALQVRPRRPVEERRLKLAPPTFEPDPRKGLLGGSTLGRDRAHDRPELDVRPTGVVATHTFARRPAEKERRVEEVRMRAGSYVDER